MDLSNNIYINAPIKHSVVMMTYNQVGLVKNALNSILNQSILPHEIIIGDDASEDGTYEIIKEYQNLYPTIIKSFQHSVNIGIFPNQNFLMERVTGDIFSLLAGDDVFKADLFYELNKVIVDKNINLKDDFVVVTNTSNVDFSGKEHIFDNFKNRHKNVFKQRLRYSIDYRSVGISVGLLKKAGPIIEDIGYHADWLWSLKIDYLSKKYFYTPYVSFEYHSGIGVVSKTKRELLADSMFKVLELIKKEFGKDLDKKDLLYLKLVYHFEKYQVDPSLKNYINYLKYYLKNSSNLGGNNYMMNYKNFIPKQLLQKLVIIKSLIKK